ncbi:GTP-binding protein RAD-like [Parasteatoda tepidariorum]|uniref:GTP-binding protein RAD-like n=1 Tax=Parasteatoda tepidariorum TaxID=114398 RepID=UPI0039BCA534
MFRHRSHNRHSSHLQRSTPDLTADPKSDSKSPRSNWRTSSANIPHRRGAASPSSDSAVRSYATDTSSSSGDCSLSSPARRPQAASPHHNRSLSFRNMKRPTPHQMQCEELGVTVTATGFRPRGSTMPSDSASYYLARRRMRSKVIYNSSNLTTPSPPIHEPGDEEDDEYYLLRSFSINAKGAIVNRGDFIRQRSRSNNSVASTGSSMTAGNNTSCASNATSYSSGGQGRGPSSKVQILGSNGVGKSALIDQFMNSEYMNAYETHDEDLEKCVSVLLDGIEYELIFFDDPLPLDNMVLEAMTEEADAYIVAYSVTDRASFEKAVDILFSLRERGLTYSKAVILVGNKSDLARTREIAVEEGKSIACSYECKFIETSAAINHNVDELLVGMVSQIRLKSHQKEEASARQFKASPPTSSPFKKGVGSVKGSLRSSLRKRGIINRLLGKSGRSKSCDNLHVL